MVDGRQEQSSTQENDGNDRVWKIRHNLADELCVDRDHDVEKIEV